MDMETQESMNRRADSFYRSTHTLLSPMEWMRLEFRPHADGEMTVDLWITNTKDEVQPVTIHIPRDDAKWWGFEKEYLILYPDQNGIEGSPNNNYCIEFCRWLWGYLQSRCNWCVKTGKVNP